jgi:hypothetical protein
MAKATTSQNSTGKSWDLFLYMSSENNLLEQSMKNIQELRDNAQSPLMNVTIFQDLENSTNLEWLWDGNTRATVKKGQVDFADPATLRAFLDGTRHDDIPDGGSGKILVLWGHGRGMLFLPDDQTKGRAMDVIGAASILRHPKTKKEFAIIGFDACFMCVLEVISDFADACTYFIASPSLIPATGWAYAGTLKELGAMQQAPSATDLAALITRQYQTKYQQIYPNNKSIELSTIKMEDLPGVVADFRTLGEELAKYLDAKNPFAAALKEMLTYARQVASTPPGAFDYVDAVDLIRRFRAQLDGKLPAGFDPAAQKALVTACDAFLKKAVEVFLEDRSVPSFLIWFPLQPGIHARWRNIYEALGISQSKDGRNVAGWARMLRRYHGIAEDALPKEVAENADGAVLMAVRNKELQRPRLREKLAALARHGKGKS